MKNDIPIEVLCEPYEKKEVIQWAKQLHFFYIFGSFSSGPMDLPPEVKTQIRFENQQDLLEKISHFVDLQKTENVKTGNSIHDYRPIYDFPEYINPGHTLVKGVELKNTFCFIDVSKNSFQICLHGDGNHNTWYWGKENIDAALKLEKIIIEKGLQSYIEHRISENMNCISKANYPNEF